MERERERKTQQNLVHTRWLELHDLKYTIKRKEISSQRQQQRTKNQKKNWFPFGFVGDCWRFRGPLNILRACVEAIGVTHVTSVWAESIVRYSVASHAAFPDRQRAPAEKFH